MSVKSGFALSKLIRFRHSRLCLSVTIDTVRSAVSKNCRLVVCRGVINSFVCRGVINSLIVQHCSRRLLRPQSVCPSVTTDMARPCCGEQKLYVYCCMSRRR